MVACHASPSLPEILAPHWYMLQLFDFRLVREPVQTEGKTEGKRHRPQAVQEVTTIREKLEKMKVERGTYMFIEFAHRYLRIFLLQGQTPEQCIEDAAFCINFIGFWTRDIELRAKAAEGQEGPNQFTLKDNCLTRETCQDILISCNNVILLARIFSEDEHLSKVKVDMSRLSSRFSEYLFQASHIICYWYLAQSVICSHIG